MVIFPCLNAASFIAFYDDDSMGADLFETRLLIYDREGLAMVSELGWTDAFRYASKGLGVTFSIE